MRITAEAKLATRQRILHVAGELFRTRGFEATTTRDIAQSAEIATGTLFNYFETKEAIVVALAAGALDRARSDSDKQTVGTESLEESLFTLAVGELRQLRPFRKYIGPILDSVFYPLAAADR